MVDDFLISDLYFNPNLCHVCKATTTGSKKCKGCDMISYCCREHQKLHWSSHRALCLCLQGVRKELGNYYYSQFKFSNEKSERSYLGNERKIEQVANIALAIQESSSVMETTISNSLTSENNLTESINKLNIESESLSQAKNNEISIHTKFFGMENADNKSPGTSGLFDESREVLLKNESREVLLKREWTQYKYNLLNLTERLLGRPLRNVEKEIVLNPKCCIVCKQNSLELTTCESCFSVNHCSGHIQDKTHTALCEQFKLLLDINKYLVDKYLPNSFAYIERISNFLEPFQYDNDLEYHELSEYTSYYRTLAYLIQFLNFSNPSLTFHIVGASEYECSPYSVYLWENVLHRLNFIKTMKIIFVGFQVTSDQYKMRLCPSCVSSGKEMRIKCHQMTYDDYLKTCGSNDMYPNKEITKHSNISVHADLLIAYNSGFHEFENLSDSDTWRSTLELFLNTKRLPIAFTAYTKEEIQRDTQLIKDIAQGRDKMCLDFNIESEINSEASEKPRADPADGVYFLNKYISCFYCK